MMVPSVFDKKIHFVNMEIFVLYNLECSYYETCAAIFWDNSQVVTPGSQKLEMLDFLSTTFP